MNRYSLTIDGHAKTFYLPTGRHEITIDKWRKAYKYMEMSDKAQYLLDEGKVLESQAMAIESICGTMCELSDGLEYRDLILAPWDKIYNLSLIAFDWIQKEKPKTEFKINGRRFIVPDFHRRSAGDFQDVTQMLQVMERENEADKGALIAAVYMRDGEYYQDLQEIQDRVEFVKKHAKMDLFYACSFFLLNSMRHFKVITQQHLEEVREMERLTSTSLNLATTLYFQA